MMAFLLLCPLCVRRSILPGIVSSQFELHRLLPNALKMRVPIRHFQRFVPNHFFGILEGSASNQDIRAVTVP